VSGDTVTVRLDSTQTDGTHKDFAGTYTVKDGVIVAADIRRAAGWCTRAARAPCSGAVPVMVQA